MTEDNAWWTGDPGIENLFSEDGSDSKGRTVVAVNAIRVPFRRRDNAFRFLRYQLYPTVAQAGERLCCRPAPQCTPGR